MDNLNTLSTLPSERTASLESLSDKGARSGANSGEDAKLFEAALSLVKALIEQISTSGSAHSGPSGPPSDPGAGSGAPAGPVSSVAGDSSSTMGRVAAADGTGSVSPSPPSNPSAGDSAPAAPAGGPSNTKDASNAGNASKGASPSASTTSAGSGPNSTTITNTSNHDEKIGEFLNGGSTTKPVAEINLKPGQSGTLKYQNGQGGFDQEADSSGTYQPGASRLEFYADGKGKNNDDVSYIDGRNASISVSDNAGRTAGDTKSIAADAPAGAVTKDAAGNATIQGWYDGSTKAMQSGGAYMQGKLGTGDAYIHPNDDQNKAPGTNPMTMAGDTSQHYTATFGNA